MRTYRVVENLTFDSVQKTYNDIFKWIQQNCQENLQLDCSNVAFTDSAGVAMLVELQRVMKTLYQKKLSICVSHVIAQMISFYDVEDIIG